MRVHLFAAAFPAEGKPLRKGIPRAVHGLAAGLVGLGVRVTVLCLGAQAGASTSSDGYEIRSFRHFRIGKAVGLSSSLLGYIATCEEPGLFVLNGILNPSVAAAAWACRRKGIRYVVAPHCPYHPSIFGRRRVLKFLYWYLVEWPLLRGAASVQVLDLRERRWLRGVGVSTPAFEVPNGYHPDDSVALDSLEWRRKGAARFLFLGRIDSYVKGLDLLLRAIGSLGAEHDAQLVLQGPDGGDRRRLAKLAQRLGIGRRIEFRDPEFQLPSAQVIADHDVLVLSSRFEGFGLVALEAMLAGRVVLASDRTGIAPHIRESGCGAVVAPSVDDIKSGLEQILSCRNDWPAMGLRGREYALENLTWSKISAQALEHYRELYHAGIG